MLAYLDDILVYSASWKDHLQHLDMVFKHLKEASLNIKLSKFQFFKKQPHYLVHLISEDDIQLLPEKVAAIQKVKKPSNIDDPPHFLSLTGCYKKYVPLYTDVTKPLNKLLKKETKFLWSPQC